MTTATLTRPIASSTHLKPASIGADFFTLVIGLACSFTVRLIGDLPVAEILLLPILPVLLIVHGRRIFKPRLRVIGILMAIWLIGQVLTDVYRGTVARDWMRGDARIIFFAIDLVCLVVLLTRNERRKVIFIAGYALGSLLAVKIQPGLEVADDPWKFGYSRGTIILVVLISCFFYRHRQYFVTGVFLAGIMGVNLLENYRSPVLDLLVASSLVMPVVPERIGRLRILPPVGSKSRVVVLAFMALAAGMLASGLVHLVTATGIIGAEAQAKNQVQSRSRGGILLGGRPEILVSSHAVMDSPILGHGSYANDFKYTEMLNDIQVENGIPTDLQDEEAVEGTIPAHSHLMSTWVQAGVLGALFWIYMFWWVFRAIVWVATIRPSNAPLYALLLVEFSWNILFSPFGNLARMQEAFVLVIILDLGDSWSAILRASEQIARNRLVGRRNPRMALQPR